jgi:hypothetical protein
MELTGTLKAIMPTQTKGDFQFREAVITTDEQYPQDILVQFVKDKCAILDSYKVGQKVTIGINLRGKAWTNPQSEVKYFNTIQGWKINAVEGAQPQSNLLPGETEDDLPY